MMKIKTLIFCAVNLLVLLSGCGGGGGGGGIGASSSVVNNPCSVPTRKYGEVTFPESYKGNFKLPNTSQKLQAEIVRMIDTKDYFPSPNSYTSQCTDKSLYAKNAYSEELDRLKALGTEVVWITNYGPWLDLKTIPWALDKSRLQIPEEDFSSLVSAIKSRGMKVYFFWQMWGVDVKGNEYPMGSNFSISQLQNWMVSHRQLMIDLSLMSQRLGIDGLGVDWQAYFIPNIQEANLREYYVSSLSDTIDDIKKRYSGKLVMGLNGHLFPDSRLLNKVDYVRLSLTANVSEQDNKNLSVELLKGKFKQSLDAFGVQFGDMSGYAGRPKFEVQFAIQSRDRYFVDGWVEDGFCVSGMGSSCVQKTYITDFSVQAVGTEAAFQAIAEQKFLSVGAVTTGVYWHTDDMTPGNYGSQSDFPNLSASIRNKPAEGIVRSWYTR